MLVYYKKHTYMYMHLQINAYTNVRAFIHKHCMRMDAFVYIRAYTYKLYLYSELLIRKDQVGQKWPVPH